MAERDHPMMNAPPALGLPIDDDNDGVAPNGGQNDEETGRSSLLLPKEDD